MSNSISFYKTNNLPSNFTPNSVYFVNNSSNDSLDIYVTDNAGSAYYNLYSKANLDSRLNSLNIIKNKIPIGAVIAFTKEVNIPGFLRCNGASVSRTTYSSLFSVVGTRFNQASDTSIYAPWNRQQKFNQEDFLITSAATVHNTLPVANAFGSAVVLNKKVYLFTGRNSTQYNSYIYKATIDDSGNISSWTLDNTIVNGLNSPTVVAHRNRLYLIGLRNSGTFTNSVYSIAYDQITGDLLYSTIRQEVSYPINIFNPDVFVFKDRLYVAGGLTTNTAVTNLVRYSQIDSNGALGPWQTSGNLNVSRGGFTGIILGNYYYAIGGYTGGTNSSNNISRAILNNDGTLGSWATYGTIPSGLHYYNPLVTAKRIYLIGGITGTTYQNTVRSAAILANKNPNGTWHTFNSVGSVVAAGCSFATSSALYIAGGMTASNTYTSNVIKIPIVGGLNNYLDYLLNPALFDNSINFNLPDYTHHLKNSLYHYIRAF